MVSDTSAIVSSPFIIKEFEKKVFSSFYISFCLWFFGQFIGLC